MRGGVLLVLSSLVVESSGPSLSARQQTATAPALPLADDRTDMSTRHNGEAERRDDEPTAGIKGWISRHLGTLASPTRDGGNGLSVSAGIIVAGSGLSGGVGYRRLNLLKGRIDVEVDGKMSVRRYQQYRAALASSTREPPRSNSTPPTVKSRPCSTPRLGKRLARRSTSTCDIATTPAIRTTVPESARAKPIGRTTRCGGCPSTASGNAKSPQGSE